MTDETGPHRPLREVLREAGAAPHAQLDAVFTAHLSSVAGYIYLLQTLESFHRSSDVALSSWVAGSGTAPDVTVPERSAALRRDLLRLGSRARPPLDLSDLPRDPRTGLLTTGAGLALLYVVAGSSIGARIVLRQLSDVVPADARAGLREGAGPAGSRLWQATLVALGSVASPAVMKDATTSCRLLFEALRGRAAATRQVAAS